MGYENLQEKLIAAKNEGAKNYISILSNGETVIDNLDYFNNSSARNCKDFMFMTMEDMIKDSAKKYGSFEYAEFDYAFGPIYDKEEYDKNNGNIEGLDVAFRDMRFYSYDTRIYNDQKMIKKEEYIKGYPYGIQSTIDYDELMSKLDKNNFLIKGPATSEELIEEIKKGNNFLVTIGVNLSNKKLSEVCPNEKLSLDVEEQEEPEKTKMLEK